MHPSPLNVRSCRAITVAEARRSASTVISVVTSRVALSSFSAPSRMASIRFLFHSIVVCPLACCLFQFFERCPRFFQQNHQLRRARAQSFHHICRSLAQKSLIAKLPLRIGLLFLKAR